MTQSLNRQLRNPLLLLATLIVTLTIAGCGGTTDTDKTADAKAEAPELDACTLFTYDDARAIAGESLAGMSSTLDDAVGRHPGQCIYNSGTLEEPRILSLLIRDHKSPESAQRILKSSRSYFSTMSGGNVQDVPGLGDGALWVGARIQQLHVIRGATQFVITVQSPDGKTDQLPHARQVAEKVLSRMGKA